jgi:hypothetical protein
MPAKTDFSASTITTGAGISVSSAAQFGGK